MGAGAQIRPGNQVLATAESPPLTCAVLALALAGGCVRQAPVGPSSTQLRALASLARDYSSSGLRRVESSMDPAMVSLARRMDRAPHPDLWGRPQGWAALDIQTSPWLGFDALTPDRAMRINAYLPAAPTLPPEPRPYYLRAA